MAQSTAIPAPGFRTFEADERPHLPTLAIRAVMNNVELRGVKVEPSALALLVLLADAVHSRHGQWYGSWQTFADEYSPWSLAWVYKWLERLEKLGLVENLGRLPGRRTTTWQILPRVYRLHSTDVETSESGRDSTLVETDTLQPCRPLVSTKSPNPSTPVETNTRTPLNTKGEHPTYVGDESPNEDEEIPCEHPTPYLARVCQRCNGDQEAATAAVLEVFPDAEEVAS